MNITLSNLSIGYRGHQPILSGINATVSQGQFACLVGQNGAGKSTLLKTIAGFVPRRSGELSINGHDIAQLSQHQRARLIGIVLTGRTDIEHLTVHETVGLGRTPYTGFFGKLTSHDTRIIDQALTITGIENLASRRLSTLSDGELQKTMIARTLAQQTPIILLDEPTAFLDYHSRIELFRLLSTLTSQNNKLIILSTHDLELAARFADKLFEIKKGKLHPISSVELNHNIKSMFES